MLKELEIEILDILLLLTAISLGYLISDYPVKFLNIFHKPLPQFIILFLLFISIKNLKTDLFTENNKKSLKIPIFNIIIQSIIMVFILQYSKKILIKIYK
jgi:chromate transport protein ChrA